MTRPDCKSCIEDFGQRHRMRLLIPRDESLEPVALCEYHDRPFQRMTISSMDPAGVMPRAL